MRLLRNHRALAIVAVGDRPPDPDQWPETVGEVKGLRLDGNSCSATLLVPEKAWAWISLAPVKGWRWRLDGRPLTLEQGPGIVQFVEVAAGEHRIDGRYLPPAFHQMAVVSCVALLITFGWLAYETRRRFEARLHGSAASGDQTVP
jgi:hypothetical protein